MSRIAASTCSVISRVLRSKRMPSRSCLVGTVRYSVARETDNFSAVSTMETAS